MRVVLTAEGQVFGPVPDPAEQPVEAELMRVRMDTRGPHGGWSVVDVEDFPAFEAITVGELIQQLHYWPSDMKVLVEDGRGWYREVRGTMGPSMLAQPDAEGHTHDAGESTGYTWPTILFGETYDQRND